MRTRPLRDASGPVLRVWGFVSQGQAGSQVPGQGSKLRSKAFVGHLSARTWVRDFLREQRAGQAPVAGKA